MDLIALILNCAPQIHPHTLLSIIKVESRENPLALYDNTDKKTYNLKTKEEAIETAKALLSKGHLIDLGLGQINSNNLKFAGITLEDAFDPCKNITASGKILSWNYQNSIKKHGPGQKALMEAISTYNTGHSQKGVKNGYVAKVKAQAVVYQVPAIESKRDEFIVENQTTSTPQKEIKQHKTPENSDLRVRLFDDEDP